MKTTEKKTDALAWTELVQAYGDEAKARALLESWRWPHGPVCPHCQNTGEKTISPLKPQPNRPRGVRAGVYFCGACRRQFTVTVGTVLERSQVPLAKWLLALCLLCSAKKSVSANQIHRMLGVTYKTAWFMCHRIRLGMTPQRWAEAKLTGTVEVDETFVGPKAKPKSAVVALVERRGAARVQVIASVTQKNLDAVLGGMRERSSGGEHRRASELQAAVEGLAGASDSESLTGGIPAPEPRWLQDFDHHR